MRSFFRLAQEKLQSPLQILLCLAVENGPNVSAVREYFLQSFQNNNDSVKNVSCVLFIYCTIFKTKSI